MKTTAACIVILLVFLASAGGAETIVVGGVDGLGTADTTTRYPVGLALSGGGARGLATIGLLKAFEERGIEIAAVTGTSIGGIVGGLYACGYSADQLTEIVRNFDLSGLFTNQPARRTMFLTQRAERDRHLLLIRFQGLRPVIPQALTAGHKILARLAQLTARANYRAGGDFDRLPIRFRTISTDLVSGREVILDRGSLAEAMRATMAFPLAFTPLENGPQLLMDGGMVTPIPVTLTRSLVADETPVIAVNTTSPLLTKEKLISPVDIANQATSIMTADQLEVQLQEADFVVVPALDSLEMTDFTAWRELIGVGYETGLEVADSIVAYYRARPPETFRITEVKAGTCPAAVAARLSEELLGRSSDRKALQNVLQTTVKQYGLLRLEAELAPAGTDNQGTRLLYLTACPAPHVADVNLEFSGNRIFSDSLLTTFMRFPDTALTDDVLRAALDSLESAYRRAGYDLAYVARARYDAASRTLRIEVDEAVIRHIEIEGNERTRDWLVRAYFPLKVGDGYSTSRAGRGMANIFGTDLFNSVGVELLHGHDGARVRIRVEEKQNPQLRLGWHWDDVYQSEELGEFLDDNVLGIGLQYLLHARYARHRQRFHAALKLDRIFSTYMTARVSGHHDRLDRSLFDRHGDVVGQRRELRTGGELRFGQQISRLGTVSAAVGLEQIEYCYDDQTPGERFGLRTLRLESLVENFDRIPFPETGKRHRFEVRVAGEVLGGEVEYTRFYSSVEAYWQLTPRLNYHPRLEIGLSRSGLPAAEQFYLGGIHSFAGLRRHQLAGDKVFTISNELRLKLPLRLYLTARYDMGDVYGSADQIRLATVRHGIGAILAFDSPLGPFELAYGNSDGDHERWYLNIGLQF